MNERCALLQYETRRDCILTTGYMYVIDTKKNGEAVACFESEDTSKNMRDAWRERDRLNGLIHAN